MRSPNYLPQSQRLLLLPWFRESWHLLRKARLYQKNSWKEGHTTMLSCLHYLNKAWRAWMIWVCAEVLNEFFAVAFSSVLLHHQDRKRPMLAVSLAAEVLDSPMKMAIQGRMEHDRSVWTGSAEKTYFAAWVPLSRQELLRRMRRSEKMQRRKHFTVACIVHWCDDSLGKMPILTMFCGNVDVSEDFH